MSYWEECVSEALIEVGITATYEQEKKVGEFVEVAYDNYDIFTGASVARSNYLASQESEQKKLIANAEGEHQKEIELLEKKQEDRENSLWRRIRALEDEVRNLNNQLGAM